MLFVVSKRVEEMSGGYDVRLSIVLSSGFAETPLTVFDLQAWKGACRYADFVPRLAIRYSSSTAKRSSDFVNVAVIVSRRIINVNCWASEAVNLIERGDLGSCILSGFHLFPTTYAKEIAESVTSPK